MSMSGQAKVQSIVSVLALASMAGLLALEMTPDASWKIRVPLVIVFLIVAAIGLAFAILAWCDRPRNA